MTLSPEQSPVLRGADLDALPLATLIVADAPIEEPDGLVEDELTDAGVPEVVLDDLLAEAHRRGLEEGAAAAEASMRSLVQSTLAALDAAARDLDRARSTWEAIGPLDTVSIALEIAEMILMREVATAADPGRDAIARCLAEMAAKESATIRLNPDDVSRLGPLDDLLAERSFEIVPDPMVVPGDAVADTPTGSIDARLRGALGRVREELLR